MQRTTNFLRNFLAVCLAVGLGLLSDRLRDGGEPASEARDRPWRRSWPIVLALVPMIVGVGVAGSRGGYLALAAGLCYFGFAERARRGGVLRLRRFRRALVVLVALTALALGGSPAWAQPEGPEPGPKPGPEPIPVLPTAVRTGRFGPLPTKVQEHLLRNALEARKRLRRRERLGKLGRRCSAWKKKPPLRFRIKRKNN